MGALGIDLYQSLVRIKDECRAAHCWKFSKIRRYILIYINISIDLLYIDDVDRSIAYQSIDLSIMYR